MPTLCVPPGLFPIFFLFFIIVFEGGGGGRGSGDISHIRISKGENYWNQVNLVIDHVTCEAAFISVLRLFLNVICKQLLDKAFVISGIIKVEVFGLG